MALEALLKQSGPSSWQRQKIKKQLSQLRAGDAGERDVAYFIDSAYGEGKHTAVIHDLRMEVGQYPMQIDHLIVTRFKEAIVIESKNYNADLHCNEAGEWTAIYEHGPRAIASPVEQVRRQADKLRKWFDIHNVGIRCVRPIVLVSPTTKIERKFNKTDADVDVWRADLLRRGLLAEIDKMSIAQLPGALWSIATLWNKAKVADTAARLVAAHQPIKRDWAAQFGIAPPPPRAAPGTSSAPSEIVTRLGTVQLKPVSDGRIAIRHVDDPALAELVKNSVGPAGSWQLRFKNWLVPREQLAAVIARLQQ